MSKTSDGTKSNWHMYTHDITFASRLFVILLINFWIFMFFQEINQLEFRNKELKSVVEKLMDEKSSLVTLLKRHDKSTQCDDRLSHPNISA